MDQLKEMGEFVRSASSTIEAPVVRRLKEAFSAKAADQPAQANQGSQGSRPRPGGNSHSARRATARPRAAPGANGRHCPSAGGSGCPRRPRRRGRYRRGPQDRARRDGQRLRGAGGRTRRCRRDRYLGGARRGRQAAAAGPAVGRACPAGRNATPGQPRCPAGARAAAPSGHPGRLPQPGRGPAIPAPALGAASQYAGWCSRAAPRRFRGSSGPGRQARRVQAPGTWCPSSGRAQARRTGPASGGPAAWPAAG